MRDARAKGATPVLITPMHRMTFDADDKITNSLGDYPEAVRRVAREQNVPLIDLHAMSKTLYEAVGSANAKRLFAKDDPTHHSDYGSYELAKCVVEGIRASGLPLAKMISDGPAFDPAHPDPPQRLPQTFVIGDSTASNGPERGWGSHLAVENRARAGPEQPHVPHRRTLGQGPRGTTARRHRPDPVRPQRRRTAG